MNDHPNVERARRAYDMFNTGDLESLREFMDEDVVWHQGGHDALSGDYKGIDGVLHLFSRMYQLAGDYRAELVDVFGSDERTIAIERVTATRNGRRWEDVHPVIFEGPGPRAREVWSYSFDDAAKTEFWGPPM